MAEAAYFVGIGAAKAGTSWLADYLAGHPEVALSPIKELHYFDAMHLRGQVADWNGKWRKILTELEEKQRLQPSAELAEKKSEPWKLWFWHLFSPEEKEHVRLKFHLYFECELIAPFRSKRS